MCGITLTAEEDALDLSILKLNSSDSTKKEAVCSICEKSGELTACDGQCQGAFHPSCLGLSTPPTGTFKCAECVSGIHTCFICKKASSDTKRCQVAHCGRFYHEECVKGAQNTKQDANSFCCPLHTCATCASNDCATMGKGVYIYSQSLI